MEIEFEGDAVVFVLDFGESHNRILYGGSIGANERIPKRLHKTSPLRFSRACDVQRREHPL